MNASGCDLYHQSHWWTLIHKNSLGHHEHYSCKVGDFSEQAVWCYLHRAGVQVYQNCIVCLCASVFPHGCWISSNLNHNMQHVAETIHPQFVCVLLHTVAACLQSRNTTVPHIGHSFGFISYFTIKESIRCLTVVSGELILSLPHCKQVEVYPLWMCSRIKHQIAYTWVLC